MNFAATMERLRECLPPDVRQQMEQEEKRIASIASEVQQECAKAIESAAFAIRFPTSASSDLERAVEHLKRALAISQTIDPLF